MGWACTLRNDQPKIIDADFEVVDGPKALPALRARRRGKTLPPYSTAGRWSNDDIEKTIRRAWLAVMLFAAAMTVVGLWGAPSKPKPDYEHMRILQPGPDGYCAPDAICPQPVPSKR